MRKILLTGGAGFIGSHLSEKLVHNGDFVIALDNFDPYYDSRIKKNNIVNLLHYKNFKLVRGDILDIKLVEDIFNKYSIDYVVHLAAKVGVRGSVRDPISYAKINVGGTLNLLEILKNKRIKNFIFTSSSSVYGANKKIPFSEDDSTNSQLSPYAVSKRSAELFCKQYSYLYGIPTAVLRLFTVYGPRQRPDLVIAKFIGKIVNNKEIKIYGDGSSARDFIYIDDVVDAILKSLDKQFRFEIFNVGSSHPVTINYLISYLEKIISKKAKKKYFPHHKEDMKKTHADIRKAKKLLYWQPKIDFKTELKRIISPSPLSFWRN